MSHLPPFLQSQRAYLPALLYFSKHLFLPPSDVSPLSAPAFSFCFPLLNAMLKDSSGSSEEVELLMTRALQVIAEHCQLRAADNKDMVIDEVGGC